MTKNLLSFRDVLLQEYSRRKAQNGMYSIRAFARDLKIGSTTLSDVMGGRRNLSRNNAIKVSNKLGFSPDETDRLLSEIFNSPREKKDSSHQVIEEDQFNFLSNWYYFAILSLANLPNNSSDPKWVAKKLGISSIEAQTAMRALSRLGMIGLEDGQIQRLSPPVSSTHEKASVALKKHHQQLLCLANQAIFKEPLSRRHISAVTMAIDSSKLKQAKTLIHEFLVKLSELLEDGVPDDVFTLSVQLFPLKNHKGEQI